VVYDIERSAEYMDAIAEGWMMAKQARPLFGIDWKSLWSTPLDEVRDVLNIKSSFNP
jgi:ubiquinone biosynthesis protein Coq4